MKKLILQEVSYGIFSSISLKMKLTTFLLIVTLLKIQANGYSQNTEISLQLTDVTIKNVLAEIEKQSEFKFFYESGLINLNEKISIFVRKKRISNILKQLFVKREVSFEIVDKHIILRPQVVKTAEIKSVLDVTAIQSEIKGTVSDSNGQALAGVNIVVKETTYGTVSDFDGNYTISLNDLPATLVFSFLGYETKEISVSNASTVNVILEESATGLDEAIVLGNRSKPRTVFDSPVPIDNIGIEELKNTGQLTVDKMLTYKVPSFNSTNQTISDGTAHFDPADLRGTGPSRTLVLINGKRKNSSALVYINDTPGKGEVGVDLKSIPIAAIERIEVLRDGASAQYGSDAIAGVINMVLKKNVDYTTITAKTGITTQGDGLSYAFDINTELNLFKEKGYSNITAGYYHQDFTNRAGKPGGDNLFGFLYKAGEIGIEDADGFLASAGKVATGAQILSGDTEWQKENPDLGAIVGQPEMGNASMFYNLGYDLSPDIQLYSFGGGVYRKGKSFALYRAPWWPGVPGQNSPEKNPLYDGVGDYQGFQPTFETKILDLSFDIGIKGDLGNDWNFDISTGMGSSVVDYEVNNSISVSLGANSPTEFKVGGYEFKDWVSNIDINKSFGDLGLSVGAEHRLENFIANAGVEDSYKNGGVQSFPGLQPENEVDKYRNNIGFYGDLVWDINDDFLIGGAIRYENYSDFGNNVSWKINSRIKFLDNKAIFRTSLSTGFRAPSLHQIYLSNIQTLVSAGTISNQGTFNNVDDVIRKGLGVKQLDAETALNFTAGFAFKPMRNLSIVFDYYRIAVDDRVLFTGEIGYRKDNPTDDKKVANNPIEIILADNKITSLKFFTNAVNTITQGVDFVLNYSDVELGNIRLDATLSANINDVDISGKIAVPKILADNGYSNDFFNRKEQSRILSSRPKEKILLGLNFSYDKFNFIVNNTYFGEVKWQHASDPKKDQIFAGKIITDLGFNYKFSEKISALLSINNLLNVYPDVVETKGDPATDVGGRFKYAWDVNQFGFNGTVANIGLSYKF